MIRAVYVFWKGGGFSHAACGLRRGGDRGGGIAVGRGLERWRGE